MRTWDVGTSQEKLSRVALVEPKPPAAAADRHRNTSRDPDAPSFNDCLGVTCDRKDFRIIFNGRDGSQPVGDDRQIALDGNVRGVESRATFTVHAADCPWGLLRVDATNALSEVEYLELSRGLEMTVDPDVR